MVACSGKHDSVHSRRAEGRLRCGSIAASDVSERLARRSQIKMSDFRAIYRSKKFPTSSFAYARSEPRLADKIFCIINYRLHASPGKGVWRRPLPINFTKPIDPCAVA